MLELMRRHARNWAMKVILGIVILVFIFYFGSLGGRRKAETVAIIDGRAIAYADFLREYQNLIDVYQQRFGDKLTPEVLRRLNLKQQTLDSLVDQAIILQKAQELHIEVTNEEVRSAIFSSPLFQRGGVFDDRLYQYFLHSRRMSSEEMEAVQEKLLTSARLQDLIQDSVKVSDKELYDLYKLQNEKMNVAFLDLNPRDFKRGIKPTRRDLEDYIKDHGSEFRVAEKVQIKYLAFLGRNYAQAAPVTEADVKGYYEQHEAKRGDRGNIPPLTSVRDRIIQELRESRGLYQAAAEAKKAHDTIYQEENFDAYAAGNRLQINTTNPFPLNSPPPEFSKIPDFAQKVFHLQKEEISSVLSNEKGYYVCQVTARKPSHIPALAEIEKEVEDRYSEAKARQLCREAAETILAKLRKREDAAAIAGQGKLRWTETGYFMPGSSVPKIGSSQELSEALYLLSPEKPYPERVFEAGGNIVILKLRGTEPVNEGAYTAQKDGLKKLAMTMKRSETVRSWLQENKASLVREGRLKFTREIKDL